MREFIGLTSDEIETKLRQLQPDTKAFQDCIDELRHRSTNKAKRLLKKYSGLTSISPQVGSAEERLADIRKTLLNIERGQEELREALRVLALKANAQQTDPAKSRSSPPWSLKDFLEKRAREESEERERIRTNNERMWSALELEQRREKRILDRLIVLPTEALRELWERKSWILDDEDDEDDEHEELDETELRILRAVLRARILSP